METTAILGPGYLKPFRDRRKQLSLWVDGHASAALSNDPHPTNPYPLVKGSYADRSCLTVHKPPADILASSASDALMQQAAALEFMAQGIVKGMGIPVDQVVKVQRELDGWDPVEVLHYFEPVRGRTWSVRRADWLAPSAAAHTLPSEVPVRTVMDCLKLMRTGDPLGAFTDAHLTVLAFRTTLGVSPHGVALLSSIGTDGFRLFYQRLDFAGVNSRGISPSYPHKQPH